MSKKLTGKEIKQFRESIGETQEKFSKRLGFAGYGWLSAIENGKAKVTASTEIKFRSIQKELTIN